MKNAEFFRSWVMTDILTDFRCRIFTARKTIRFIFTAAKEGHKIDAIKNYEKASFCVYDSGYRKEDDWALNINSVIVFGKIRLVTDPDLTRQICTKLVQKFTDDQEYLEKELKNALPRVQCLELEIEHMTGKLVNES